MLCHGHCGTPAQLNANKIFRVQIVPNITYDKGAVFSMVNITPKTGETMPAEYFCDTCGRVIEISEIVDICSECLDQFPVSQLIKIENVHGCYCLPCSEHQQGRKKSLAKAMGNITLSR